MASAKKGGGQSLQLKETQLPTHQEVCVRWRAAFSTPEFRDSLKTAGIPSAVPGITKIVQNQQLFGRGEGDRCRFVGLIVFGRPAGISVC